MQNESSLLFSCFYNSSELFFSKKLIKILKKMLKHEWGFFKALWYISLNPFVSKLPSGSYKYTSLTSSGSHA